jgi:hypothetical protein
MRRAAVVAAALLTVTALAAGAHQSDPAVVTLLDSVTPALPPGVRVAVVASVAAQLVAENTTATPLEVLDEEGNAFVRISLAGVEADVASPSWRTSNSPGGGPGSTRRTSPHFVLVTRAASWGWFDHRLHPVPLVIADPRSTRRMRLAEWTVPLRYGDVALTLRGHVERRPLLGRLVAEVTSAPLPAGIELRTLDGRVPGLFLRAITGERVRVLGADGEVFAEFSQGGVVANRASRIYVEDSRAKGLSLPDGAPASDATVRVASASSYSWLDLRLRYAAAAVPDDVQRRGEPTVLVRWTIPIEVGAVRHEVTGTTSFVPFEKRGVPFEDPPARIGVGPVLVVVLPIVLLAAVIVFRRRATYDRADRRAGP